MELTVRNTDVLEKSRREQHRLPMTPGFIQKGIGRTLIVALALAACAVLAVTLVLNYLASRRNWIEQTDARSMASVQHAAKRLDDLLMRSKV